MTREELRRLLVDFGGEATETVLEVLDDPMADLRADDEVRPTPTSNLLTIYRRRARHVREIGLPTIGFSEAVERFEATTYDALRIAVAHGPGGHPWAVAFVSPDRTEVVAAVAILQQMPPS